jgi:hypothetical protein
LAAVKRLRPSAPDTSPTATMPVPVAR